jgi:cell division protein FtsW
VKRLLSGLTGNFEPADWGMLASVGTLLFLGVLVVYGAGSYDRLASTNVLGNHYVGIKHLLMICLGLVGLFTLANVNFKIYRTPLIMWGGVAVGLALLGLTLFGKEDITRWVSICGVRFQPVELSKLAVIIYLADRLTELTSRGRLGWKDLLRMLALVPLPVLVLLCLQPNFGNVLTLLVVILALFFVAEVPWKKLSLMVGVPFSLAVLAFLTVPKLSRRLGTWWDGLVQGDFDYQVHQSLVGLGAGGTDGLGLGNSHNKFSFLPEAHTDFIFSVLGEELGLVGTIFVIALFMVFVWCGLSVAARSDEPFGRYLATGLTISLASYGVANIAMVTGLIPVVGVPLPFVSFGGTAMVAALASVGILLNIDRGNRSFQQWKKRWERKLS